MDLIRFVGAMTRLLIVPSQGGLTVLMAASFRGLTAIVSLLLQHGAELELRSREVSDRPSPPLKTHVLLMVSLRVDSSHEHRSVLLCALESARCPESALGSRR
jgi:ankyrin repeat protein